MHSLIKAGLGLAGVLTASLSIAAAADLPTHKEPLAPPPPPPFAPWTGAYVGGFAGGSWLNSAQGYSVDSPFLDANFPSIVPQVNNDGSQLLRGSSADIGVEAGYNWNASPGFVVGVAADAEWSGLKASRSVNGFLLPAFAPLLPYTITQQLNNDWRGSLRLRAGWTPMDNLLLYATGGPALGGFTYKATFWDRLDPPFYTPDNETENAKFSKVRAGWTLGAGAEWRFARNWSVAGEYRHWEFASFGGTGTLPLVQPTSTALINHSTGTIRIDSLRVGVNYHFE